MKKPLEIHFLELEALIEWHTDERNKARRKGEAEKAEGHQKRMDALYAMLDAWKQEIELLEVLSRYELDKCMPEIEEEARRQASGGKWGWSDETEECVTRLVRENLNIAHGDKAQAIRWFVSHAATELGEKANIDMVAAAVAHHLP